MRKRSDTIDKSTRALSTGMLTLAHAFAGQPITGFDLGEGNDEPECDSPASKKMMMESECDLDSTFKSRFESNNEN